jgi:hypothetical protein
VTQTELDYEIAKATGETLKTIRQRGFSPLWPIAYERDRKPLTVDWDQAEANRDVLFPIR